MVTAQSSNLRRGCRYCALLFSGFPGCQHSGCLSPRKRWQPLRYSLSRRRRSESGRLLLQVRSELRFIAIGPRLRPPAGHRVAGPATTPMSEPPAAASAIDSFIARVRTRSALRIAPKLATLKAPASKRPERGTAYGPGRASPDQTRSSPLAISNTGGADLCRGCGGHRWHRDRVLGQEPSPGN